MHTNQLFLSTNIFGIIVLTIIALGIALWLYHSICDVVAWLRTKIKKRTQSKSKNNNMKKIIIFTAMLIISLASVAQPFIGLEAGSKGAGVNLGIVGNNLEFKVAYNRSLYKSTTPALTYAHIGYQINLTGNETDNLSLTPAIGYAYRSYEDFTQWNQGGEIIKVTEFKPKYSLELGKDKHIGRVYISANYAGYVFYNIGIRAYFK